MAHREGGTASTITNVTIGIILTSSALSSFSRPIRLGEICTSKAIIKLLSLQSQKRYLDHMLIFRLAAQMSNDIQLHHHLLNS